MDVGADKRPFGWLQFEWDLNRRVVRIFEFLVEIGEAHTDCALLMDHVVEMTHKLFARWDIYCQIQLQW
jgi:hypothetical protein